MCVEVDQKLNGPLKRLVRIFGGEICVKNTKNPRNGAPLVHWRWKVLGSRAAGVMMTVYPFMCPRRKQRIRECLAAWHSTRHKWYWRDRHFEKGWAKHMRTGMEARKWTMPADIRFG